MEKIIQTPSLLDKETSEKSNDELISRRHFLKLGTTTLAALALSGLHFGTDRKKTILPTTSKEDTSSEIEKIRQSLLEEKWEVLPETIPYPLQEDDLEIIGKTFNEQLATQDHITLDKSTQKAILHNWKNKYAPGTFNYQKGLVAGLERMRPWIGELKEIFSRYSVPEKYIYLAIAESHFSNENVSHAGAAGPFQITKETSQLAEFSMSVSTNYDERLDPLKSAELCAKHLRYSYRKFGYDWDLALLDYNGGYTKKFLLFVRDQEAQRPAEQITLQKKHILQEGENLSQLAQQFETSLTLLYRKNATAGESFSEWISSIEKAGSGKEILIPEKRKISLINFHAWLEKEVNAKIQTELTSNTYTVSQGDTLTAIAKKFQMDVNLLKSLNQDIHNTSLRAGQSLHIPANYKKRSDILKLTLSSFNENINYPGKFEAILQVIQENNLDLLNQPLQTNFIKAPLKRSASLQEISNHENIDLTKLSELNPAVKNTNSKLPASFKVRLPTSHLIAKK
jgi:LysM repeat protein